MATVKTAILIYHLYHYHAARFRAYAQRAGAVTVICMTARMDCRELSALDEPNRPYMDLTLFSDSDEYLRAVRSNLLWSKVIEALENSDPDLVVVPGWAAPEGLAALAWARQCGRSVVVMSESQEADGRRTFAREFIKRQIVKACNSALVGGHPHRDYLIRLGFPPEKICFGYDAVDNTYFERTADNARSNESVWRTALGLPNRYVLASGRFIPKKNFATLIRAYAKYAAGNCATHHLVILGDGVERRKLERMVDDLGVRSRVHMPGFRGYNLLPIFYGLASFFVHVSTIEQWGLVVNEAMASGLAVIASRTCGSAHDLVIDGITGYKIDPLDADLLAARIRFLAANEANCLQMGAAAQKAVSAWGPNRFAEGLVRAGNIALNDREWRSFPFIEMGLMKILSQFNLEVVP